MKNHQKIFVGTRTSKLALVQANIIIDALETKNPHLKGIFEIVGVVTSGDMDQSQSLADSGGKALFSKEIHQQLWDGRIHFAVHSLKDLEAYEISGIHVACVKGGEHVRDVLVGPKHMSLVISDLPKNAVVGTCSPRRTVQLLHQRPDLDVRPIRGNVETRLKKLEKGDFYAIILAEAGLRRLGLWTCDGEEIQGYTNLKASIIPVSHMLPAVGQGVIAVDCRTDDIETQNLLSTINDPVLLKKIKAERFMLQMLHGNCHTAVGCLSNFENDIFNMAACYAPKENEKLVFASCHGPADQPELVAEKVAKKLLKATS